MIAKKSWAKGELPLSSQLVCLMMVVYSVIERDLYVSASLKHVQVSSHNLASSIFKSFVQNYPL